MDATENKAARVQAMFNRIVQRYDVVNRAMTLGRDQAWRRLTARKLRLPDDGLCLDLATGTGDIALAVAARYPSARIVAVDFVYPMLQAGVMKSGKQRAPGNPARIAFAQGDALRLPFPDAAFDGLTNGFLLRNLADLPGGLAEMRRVVKPGRRVACLEITRPATPIFRELFHLYFYRLVPIAGGIISGDRQAYTYLPNSLTRFPRAGDLKTLMLETGYRQVDYTLLGLGTLALHVATV